MWRAGRDTLLRMTIGNLMVLDGRPTGRRRSPPHGGRVGGRLVKLKQRPDDPTLVRSRPVWG